MTTIGDITRLGSPEELSENFAKMKDAFSALLDKHQGKTPEPNREFLLCNLCVASIIQLERLQQWVMVPGSSDLVAWCARNLFELNLLTRLILQSEENAKAWRGQAAHDEAEIYEGMAKLTEDPNDSNRRMFFQGHRNAKLGQKITASHGCGPQELLHKRRR